MEAKLIVISGKANKNEVALKLPCTIGRSREADLTIGHPMVSRQHCELSESDGVVLIRDLGSLNGTFVNGERISEARLDPNAEVTVGPLTFRVDFEYAAPAASADDVAFEAVDGEATFEEPPAAPAASGDVADTADFSGLLNSPGPAAAKEDESGETTDFFNAIEFDKPPPMPSAAGAYDVSEEAADTAAEEDEEEAAPEPTPPPPAGAKARIVGKPKPAEAEPVKPLEDPEDDYGVASEEHPQPAKAAKKADEDAAGDEEDETVPQESIKDDAKKQKKGWWPFGGKGKAEKKPLPAAESEEEEEEEPEEKPAAKPAAKAAPQPAAKPASKPAAKAAPQPASKPPAKPTAKPQKKSEEDLAFEALQDGDSEGGDDTLDFLRST